MTGRSRRITVVGDLILDRDVIGTVSRVCPDAPAPVLDVQDEVTRPGGAGLAAALLAGDGHQVRLLTTVGEDDSGRHAVDLLESRGVHVVALPAAGATRQKTRIRSGGQSLVRVDTGAECPPAAVPRDARSAALEHAEAVLVCDYAGGVPAHAAVRDAVTAAARSAPVVWDPHPRGAVPVPGCRVVTPNETEAAVLAGSGAPIGGQLGAVSARADLLRRRWEAHSVCVTLGPRGALLTQGSGAPEVVPTVADGQGDTCGAGDRFASAVAAALATGEMVSGAIEQAVAQASGFVRAGGAAAFLTEPSDATVSLQGWQRVRAVQARGGTVVATGGCFDLLHAGHVQLLGDARALGDCLVVCVNSDESVRRLKGPQRPLVPETDRVRVLEALEPVDAVVVFGEDTPAEALRILRPDVWVKGGDYALTELPEAAEVAGWGGQCVVLPYLDGRSTTTLIDAARGRAVTTTVTTKESR